MHSRRRVLIPVVVSIAGLWALAVVAGSSAQAARTGSSRTRTPATTTTTIAAPPVTGAGKDLAVYVPSWDVGVSVATMVDASRVTEAIYAFAVVQNGTCAASPADTARIAEITALRATRPSLRVTLAIGGASGSSVFASATSTVAARRTLAASCLSLARTVGADGIDIDWEYPADVTQRAQLTSLAQEFRSEIAANTVGSGSANPWQLSVALPSSVWSLSSFFDVASLTGAVDRVNLMAYDYYGSWAQWTPTGNRNLTGHHAALYGNAADPSGATNATVPVLDWISGQGVPLAKYRLGVPFYARVWGGVPGTNSGLWQSWTTLPGCEEPNVCTYRAMVGSSINADGSGANGYTRRLDTASHAPWLFSPTQGRMISYDDPASLLEKATYARNRGMAGVMAWHAGGDTDDHRLVAALRTGLG